MSEVSLYPNRFEVDAVLGTQRVREEEWFGRLLLYYSRA